MRDITLLSGGIEGGRFIRELLHAIAHSTIEGLSPETRVTVVANTADDIWAHGLKVCPDLDAVMYACGDGLDPSGNASRRDETWSVAAELAAYGVEPTWLELGDREIATQLVRTQMLEAGYPLSQVTEALCRRWDTKVTLLPMTDDRVETHVAVADSEAPSGRQVMRRQEYALRLRAAVPAEVVHVIGLDKATPAPGVLEAIAAADLVILPPCDPVASLDPILGVPGLSEALRTTTAKVVGLSPVIAGTPSGETTAAMWTAVGLESTATAAGLHYGARRTGGLLDAWLVDSADAEAVPGLEVTGLDARAVPLAMGSGPVAEAGAAAALMAAVVHLTGQP